MNKLLRYCDPTLDVVNFGDTKLNDRIYHIAIFEGIQEYINITKRFEN